MSTYTLARIESPCGLCYKDQSLLQHKQILASSKSTYTFLGKQTNTALKKWNIQGWKLISLETETNCEVGHRIQVPLFKRTKRRARDRKIENAVWQELVYAGGREKFWNPGCSRTATGGLPSETPLENVDRVHPESAINSNACLSPPCLKTGFKSHWQ